jgi:hypothetical protein
MNRIALAWLGLILALASSAFAQGGSPAVTPDGAVPVFVFAGQSNAVGVDTLDELRADQLTPQPNVLFYGPNESGNIWGPLTPSSNSPNLVDGLNRTGGSFGPEISTGKTISKALGGALVAEVKLAVGGYRPVRSVESSHRRPVSQHGRPREPIACRFADASWDARDMSLASSGCRARATQSRCARTTPRI